MTGLLTVEFLFSGHTTPARLSPASPASPASSKPVGIMKHPQSNGEVEFDPLVKGGKTEESLTSVEYRRVGPSKAAYNPYLPYDSYSSTNTSQPKGRIWFVRGILCNKLTLVSKLGKS